MPQSNTPHNNTPSGSTQPDSNNQPDNATPAPFSNLGHWRELKEIVTRQRRFFAPIRDLLKSRGGMFSRRHSSEHSPIPESVRRIDSGSNRDVYRIGRSTIPLAGRRITLAVKVPMFDSCTFGRYKNESELDQLALFDYEKRILDYEARAFEYLASQGASIPWVTGIVAGYGIIGTLTEDISECGLYIIQKPVPQSDRVIKTQKDSPVSASQIKTPSPSVVSPRGISPLEVIVDQKYAGAHAGITTDYFRERLQMNRK